ncbi:MAG: CCA tRNA nucleotidyltransferase [Defluviitaleaceae bacterium]|nr:CCA tRNA nucleotidyltransferase [Defluviitaleaceae bacterium]
MHIPPNVKKIISTLEAAGHEAFIVGGCVRDIIRGVTPKDWDIATSALPEQIKRLFRRTADTGIKHGTVTVLCERQRYEVTTYRVDGEYLDSRRPEAVTFSSKIEEDLSRRDFTINAIAYNSRFVDPFDGRGDIEKRLIKCVGVPENRFKEDALRMLRAIRFVSQLGFTLDTDAVNAIKELRASLQKISAERIREELCKLLCGTFPQEALGLLEETGLMCYVLLGRQYAGDLTALGERLLAVTPDAQMRLALFLYERPDCKEILRDLRSSNIEINNVLQYIRFLPIRISSRYEIKKALNEMPYERFQKLLELKEAVSGESAASILQEARDILEKNECFTLRGLAVNGDDLAAAGVPRGKIMGEVLARLLDLVMREPLQNTKENLGALAAAPLATSADYHTKPHNVTKMNSHKKPSKQTERCCRRQHLTQSTYNLGMLAQKKAEAYFLQNGCTLLQCNYRTKSGEIDIIAKEPSGTVVFAEVKYRATAGLGLPREAVGTAKQQKIIDTAMHYIAENTLDEQDFRFDVIELLGDELNHIENAFWV